MDDFDPNLDPELALALQLSKEEAERNAKGSGNNNASTTADSAPTNKLHTISFNSKLFGDFIINGFKDLFASNTYSDITLLLGNERIPAHKIVLCAWSDTFRVMLENEKWKESQQKDLPISIDEKDIPLFKKMLSYMYQGTVVVSYDEIVPLLGVANYYGVLSLKDACGDILAKNIDDDNVFYLLEIVQQYSCAKLNVECASFLAEHFGDMLEKDKLNNLDVETWIEMLKSDEVQVPSEEHLFNALMRYADQFEGPKRLEVLEKTLPHIRFVMLSSEFLIDKVEQNEALKPVKILHQVLHETFRYKAYPNSGVFGSINIHPRKGSFTFDAECLNPKIKLSSDKMKATNTNQQNLWTTVRCSPPISSGIWYKEFKVRFTNYLMFGIETAENQGPLKANQYSGQSASGWTWYSPGQLYHGGSVSQTQSPFSSGDTLGILADLNKGKVAFYRNGTLTNTRINNLPTGQEFCFCMSFYAFNDCATIVPTSSLPEKTPSGWHLPAQKKKASKDDKDKEKEETPKKKKSKTPPVDVEDLSDDAMNLFG